MLSLLLLAASLTPADSAGAAFRAPIQCPYETSRYTLLAPFSRAQNVPTNASVWLVENVGLSPVTLELVEQSSGSTVAFELEVTTSETFNLVRMKPSAELEPAASYTVRNASTGQSGAPDANFQTSRAPDVTPPAPPVVQGVQGASAPCIGTVLTVRTNVADPATRNILLAEDPTTKELLAFDGEGLINILATEGEDLAYDLVLLDVAGNRSEVRQRKDVVEIPEFDEGGCTCAPADATMLSWMLPLSLLVLWGTRRRTRALKSSWAQPRSSQR